MVKQAANKFARFRDPYHSDLFLIIGDLSKVKASWLESKQQVICHRAVKVNDHFAAVRVTWYKNDLTRELKEAGFEKIDEYGSEAQGLLRQFKLFQTLGQKQKECVES